MVTTNSAVLNILLAVLTLYGLQGDATYSKSKLYSRH